MAAVAGSVAIGLFFASAAGGRDGEVTPVVARRHRYGRARRAATTSERGDPATVEAAVRAALPVDAITVVHGCRARPGPTRRAVLRARRRSAARAGAARTPRPSSWATRAHAGGDARGPPRPALRRPVCAVRRARSTSTTGPPWPRSPAPARGRRGGAAVLRAGGVVVRDARYVKDGRMSSPWSTPSQRPTDGPRDGRPSAPRMSFPAYAAHHRQSRNRARSSRPRRSPGPGWHRVRTR